MNKLFELFDFKLIIKVLYGSLALSLVLLSFWIDKMGYYNIIYFIVVFIFIGTEEKTYKLIENMK